MSLLEELESRGVTAEDLEKAASVRLFEKAAAAEGVDLDSLDFDQVEELYATFHTHQSYADNTKEASAMNDEIVDLFEKTAAHEGIDLDDMADDELAELYNHYVENVLPGQIGDFEKESSVDEATEKLAEAEILGRHMARAYMDEMDEMDKEAKQTETGSERADKMRRKAEQRAAAQDRRTRKGLGYTDRKQIEQNNLRHMGSRLKELATGHQAASERAAARIKAGPGVTEKERKQLHREQKRIRQTTPSRRSGLQLNLNSTRVGLSRNAQTTAARLKEHRNILRAERLKGYGKRGLAVGAAGGLAIGAKKLMDKKSSADDIYEVAYERAEEFAKVGSVEDYDGSFIDDIACDILDEHGYFLID